MFDVVGSMCQNSDKFAVDRVLNVNPEINDLRIIHSTGAYGGGSLGCKLSAKLQHGEILRVGYNHYEVIRRAETYHDYFATLPIS